ncbi:MAG: hypothetical protein LBV41_05975 [Cytophagaceae bacterium]|jgi:Trk-type K+ transport system membrane component|nr:hypothetical protein [Cytophagaceae bacterium]
MENNEQTQSNSNAAFLQPLPKSSAALTLGILSIVICCCCLPPVGLILGIIGVVSGNNATRLYRENQGLYTESSYKNANAGKICAIIGIALSVVFMIYWLVNLPEYLELMRSIMDGTFDPSTYQSL